MPKISVLMPVYNIKIIFKAFLIKLIQYQGAYPLNEF